MQTLKIKIDINDELKKVIYEYQREYSVLLRSAFKYFENQNNNKTLKSLFDYKYISSPLMIKLKSLSNIKLMNNWFTQCAISEAYQLYKSYLYQIDEYKQKLELKEELLNKDKRTKKENKQLRKLFKLKYPKVIFGR